MGKPGLRVRVAVSFALACSIAVGALGVLLYSASERMEEALVNQIVSEELEELVARAGAGQPLAASGPNLQYYMVREAELDQLPQALRALEPGIHEIGEGPTELHVAVRIADGMRYMVAYDAGPHEQREAEFKSLVLMALAGITLFSLAFGYWLSGILTRQVTELAWRVGNLEPGGDSATLARPDQDPEVASLARALDDYQSRISSMIAREQEFTTDASHELRTPLTAIATSCELLLEEPELTGKARERLRMIAAAAAQMSEQVQILLLLAREQSPAQSEEVALGECVRDAAAPLSEEMARKHLSLEIEIAADAVLRVSRQALHAVLSNLLRNAVQYTDAGHIRVTYDHGAMTVADTGVGIAPERLPRVFERFYRQGGRGEGLGVGLAIVKRVCDHYGWRVEASSTPGQGSAFTVAFT